MLNADEARASIVKYSYKPADSAEIPNTTAVERAADMGKVSEARYVKSLAERNKCKLLADPRMSPKPASSNRLYEVSCEGGPMKFECGPLVGDRGNQSCWLL